MNILFVHNAYRQHGGEDAVVASEMALLRSHGHTVELYQRDNHELDAIAPLDAAASAMWSSRSVREMRDICELLQPDLIHVHNTFALISPSVYWVAARLGIPLVQTLHNFRLLCPQGSFLRNGRVCGDCLGKSPWRAVVHRCYRGSAPQSAVLAAMLGAHRAAGTYRHKVTRYIVLSQFSRDRFIAGGLPADRLCIKPNFVEADDQAEAAPRRGGLYVGRLSEEKGIHTLLDAVRQTGDMPIEAIGTGPMQAPVAAQFGAGYLGFCSPVHIRQKMRAAAFLIVPSTCLEQLPTTILEAFSCRLPVIASRLGALPHIVEEGVTGRLFDPGNATDLAIKMEWANAHSEAMQHMGRAAEAEYTAKYTPSINYQLLMDIYEDAIKAKQGEPHIPRRPASARHVG